MYLALLPLGILCASMGAPAPPPADLLEDVPEHFPRFYVEGAEEDAQWLGRYLWYHYKNRLGAGPTLFNKEYIATSDLWMGGSMHPHRNKTAQEQFRADLLAIRMQDDGYVETHQHFSHAHEQGWPFPMWVQGDPGRLTAGWHFQEQGFGWAWEHYLNHQPDSPFGRARAIEGWTLENVASEGIVDGRWRLTATGPSPAITTPAGPTIDAFNAPYLQLRWKRSGEAPDGVLPYLEWKREGDAAFSEERRVSILPGTGNPDYEKQTGVNHAMIAMHGHPQWEGTITAIRLSLAPGESDVTFDVDSFFTVYDTRHSINNPIYILACWDYYRWTGDAGFLQEVIGRMRTALRYQQTVMGGQELNHIRNPWPGHDGLPGFTVHPDGSKEVRHGHGIGNNYWDLLPFGWDDMYATSQYYASLLAMAEVEDAVRRHPEWGIAQGADAFEPEALREHAAQVKQTANRKFWNAETGRFFACIDRDGNAHDFGFTFLNLDAIWYGIASDERAASIMSWINGDRIVEGDTSQGADIYHWRFGPRATTLRNETWYVWVWHAPESIPWGGQVQDGGAVLGFSFYDLWARLQTFGPDDAWTRLQALLAWERDVWAEGGYRPYYADGSKGTTLQGGGTAGGLGIDQEFYESSLVPTVFVRGFLGIEPLADGLLIAPKLPEAHPRMGMTNLFYRGARLDILADAAGVSIQAHDVPPEGVVIVFLAPHADAEEQTGTVFRLAQSGEYRFTKQ